MLGSGVEGRALAAWFLAEGAEEVNLFSVYADELDALARGSIVLRGEGPVGTFRVGGEAPAIVVTSVLDQAVANADLIVVSGPVLKQRTYGLVLAPHLRDGQTIMVVPGRTLAGFELQQAIRAGGSGAEVRLVEIDDLPFDISQDGSTLMLTRRRAVSAGVHPGSSTSTIEGLQRFFPDLVPVPTLFDSSLNDGSGVVEAPALLLGGPAAPGSAPSAPPGAILLSPTSFRSLLGEAQLRLVGSLAEERRQVAQLFGVRQVPDDATWIDRFAGADSGPGVRGVPDAVAAKKLLRDAVLGSLLPLVSMADAAGLRVPVTEAVIEMAQQALGVELRATGRSLLMTGFAGMVPGEIRARMAQGL